LQIKFPHDRSESLRDIIFYLGRWHTKEDMNALVPKKERKTKRSLFAPDDLKLKKKKSGMDSTNRSASRSKQNSATGSEGATTPGKKGKYWGEKDFKKTINL